MASKTTFWNYLKNNNIEIPIIQRDYAQGRLGKENLRKTFLGDLKKALDNEPPYKDSEMKLDFVYGSTENDRLNPLDGQQRLTTLWLLHWFIALRAGMLNEENCAILRKFTYETRISSREFCQNLCIPRNFEHYHGYNIVGFITKQTWFYSAWKQDPTIQSMLRMLSGTKIADKKGDDIVDGIEELFACPSLCNLDGDKCALMKTFDNYWKRLTNKSLCPIVFYNLPLHDFGLSDDLYIKMNARGKQLTSFENFKADLIGYIQKRAEEGTHDDKQINEWELLLDSQSGIPIKFDTDWTDIFWSNKSKGIKDKDGKLVKSNQIDEIFFAFLNRFFWNELFIAKKMDNPSLFILEIGKSDEGTVQENENASYRYLNDSSNRNPNDYDTKIAYQGLDEYKYDNGIPIDFFFKLQKVLNNYYIFSKDCTIPSCQWDGSFRFIPQYIEDENSDNIEIKNNANEKILRVSTLNQVQRIVFFAICKYFDHDETVKDSEESMKRWIRVVWNLISGQGEDGRPQIRSAQAMRTAMIFINELNSHDIYNSLSDYDVQKLGNSDFDERCKEEISKAKQILDENRNLRKYEGSCKKEDIETYNTWEEIIIDAEQYAFFKGSIRFLFYNEKGLVDWTLFDLKWEHANKYFLKNTPSKSSAMQEQYRNADLLKLMIGWFSAETFWKVLWWKHRTFNNSPETWLYYLLNSDNCYAIHHLMIGENNTSDAFKDSTDFAERTINILANTSLLDFVRTQIPNSWIRDYHNHKAIFPSGTGVFLNAEKRDNLLAATEQIEIRHEHIIPETTLLFGSDINFSFNNCNFQWYRNDFVYLMEKDQYWTFVIKDEKAQVETDKYFCFNTDIIQNEADLIQKLKELIDESSNK